MTDVAMADIQEPVEPFVSAKKLKMPKFTIKVLLDLACPTPVNLSDFEKWNSEWRLGKNDNSRYMGWQMYRVTLHCSELIVIARAAKNGGYHVKEFMIRDH